MVFCVFVGRVATTKKFSFKDDVLIWFRSVLIFYAGRGGGLVIKGRVKRERQRREGAYPPVRCCLFPRYLFLFFLFPLPSVHVVICCWGCLWIWEQCIPQKYRLFFSRFSYFYLQRTFFSIAFCAFGRTLSLIIKQHQKWTGARHPSSCK